MKLLVNRGELRTAEGRLLKRLRCEFQSQKKDLHFIDQSVSLCNICKKNVHSTANATEAQIGELLQQDPNACLRVDFNQANIQVVFDEL